MIGKRYGDDRTELQKVIPLDTPYLLFIDPSSVCNFKCKFCPCGGANRDLWSKDKKVNILSYELYRKVINDLSEFPGKLKTLRLYKEGEPLLNKRIPDMIAYARKKAVADKIDFTTNGSLLEPDLSLAIIDAGINRINISIEAMDEQTYEEISGIRVDYDKILRNLTFLYKHKGNCHIFMKISDLGLGKYTERDFYEKFGELCDEMSVEHVTPVWPEFELKENVQVSEKYDIFGKKMEERKQILVCPYIFYSLCVNSDGTVSACLMDWNHQIIVGDVKKQSLIEIWNSKILQQMRIDHLKLQKDKYSTCKECGQLKYAALDDITPYREQLISSMTRVSGE